MTTNKKLKILILAPHPFFVNRGTPIDVMLVLRGLSTRNDVEVDCIVYPEGEDINLPNIQLHRLPLLTRIKGTRPGFSFTKVLLNIVMLLFTWKKVHTKRYDIIHAGEEAVFIAMLMKKLYKTPYIYDLDSSIAQQMVEKFKFLGVVASFFNWAEAQAIKGALATAPVCNALADLCRKNEAKKIVTLHDISQLENPDLPKTGTLTDEIGASGLILLYCGNLEEYQGIGLLIDSFTHVVKQETDVQLVIIGGIPEDIETYKQRAEQLGIAARVHFLGPRPFADLEKYLAEADILTAPRIRGVNTPMKIFPYMHSGKSVLLTKLPTHTQIVTDNEAYLAEAVPELFAQGIVELVRDRKLRERLGKNGRAFVEKNHVASAHKKRVDRLYDWIKEQITYGCLLIITQNSLSSLYEFL